MVSPDLSTELAAGARDLAAVRQAQERPHARVGQPLLEGAAALERRGAPIAGRAGGERGQVHAPGGPPSEPPEPAARFVRLVAAFAPPPLPEQPARRSG